MNKKTMLVLYTLQITLTKNWQRTCVWGTKYWEIWPEIHAKVMHNLLTNISNCPQASIHRLNKNTSVKNEVIAKWKSTLYNMKHRNKKKVAYRDVSESTAACKCMHNKPPFGRVVHLQLVEDTESMNGLQMLVCSTAGEWNSHHTWPQNKIYNNEYSDQLWRKVPCYLSLFLGSNV